MTNKETGNGKSRANAKAKATANARATANTKCGGLSTTQQTMGPSVASVEMTLFFGGWGTSRCK
jgi:hypothetical protein